MILAGTLFTLAICAIVAAFTGGPRIQRGALDRWRRGATRPFAARSERVHQDLRLAGVDHGTYAVQRLTGLLLGLLGGVALVEILNAGTTRYTLGIVAVAGVGWLLPSLGVRDAARKEREQIDQVIRQWIILVAQQIMAGTDPAQAMITASRVGTKPSWGLLNRHLLAAQHRQRSLWEGLDAMATNYGIATLHPIVSALALSAERGTRIADAVLAVADSSWEESVSRERERSSKRDQIVVLPATMVALGLAGILIYPPFVSLTTGGL